MIRLQQIYIHHDYGYIEYGYLQNMPSEAQYTFLQFRIRHFVVIAHNLMLNPITQHSSQHFTRRVPISLFTLFTSPLFNNEIMTLSVHTAGKVPLIKIPLNGKYH
jgi:hypothetical protein